VTAAIFGLIGVLVGGLITAGTELFLQRRRERSDARAGRLLLEAELFQAQATINVALESDWWAGRTSPPVEAWRESRVALAAEFTRAEWQVIAVGITWIDRLWSGFEARLEVIQNPYGTNLTDGDRTRLQNARTAIRAAQDVLARHAAPWSMEARRRPSFRRAR
jgi:hypothetical protein